MSQVNLFGEKKLIPKIVPLKDADRVLVFDLSNIAFSAYFANAYAKLTTKQGEGSGHIFGAFKKILSCCREHARGKTALVFSLDEFPARKHRLVPAYKTNRKKRDFDPRPDVKTLCRFFKCVFVVASKEESDDTIASFCHQNRDKEIIVYSSDKDLYQLRSMKHVQVYNQVGGNFIEVADREKKFEVNAWKKVALWKAIFGDPSDGLASPVPRARKSVIVPIINESDGTVEDFFRCFDKHKKELTKKIILLFKEGKKDIGNYYKIIKLHKKLKYKTTEYRGDKESLLKFLKSQDCLTLLGSVDLLVGKHEEKN